MDSQATGESIAQVADINLTTSVLAADRASSDLRAATVRARRDEVRLAGLNCGQELYDLVTITDAGAGLNAAKRRVLGLSWRYSTRERPGYDMTLALGNP